MTGFGKASNANQIKKIIIECKSLNSKGLDLNLRLPQIYKDMEGELRAYVSKNLERGKVDLIIAIENLSEETTTKVNASILKSYMNQLKQVVPESSDLDRMKMAINMPEVLKTERDELDKDEAKLVLKTAMQAIENMMAFIDTAKRQIS